MFLLRIIELIILTLLCWGLAAFSVRMSVSGTSQCSLQGWGPPNQWLCDAARIYIFNTRIDARLPHQSSAGKVGDTWRWVCTEDTCICKVLFFCVCIFWECLWPTHSKLRHLDVSCDCNGVRKLNRAYAAGTPTFKPLDFFMKCLYIGAVVFEVSFIYATNSGTEKV